MPRSKLFPQPIHGIEQIPAILINDSGAKAAIGLARTFETIGNDLARREDRIAIAHAKRAGAIAGGKPETFVRQEDATLVGEAFNSAAITVFRQNTAAKIRSRFSEIEGRNPANVIEYNTETKAYADGILREVETMAPEMVSIFDEEMKLRRSQGAARIGRTATDLMAHNAEATALMTERSIMQDLTQDAKDVDFTDIGSTTAYFINVRKKQAELAATYQSLAPNGLPLFDAEKRVKAMQEFEDAVLETSIMSNFNQMVAANAVGSEDKGNAVQAMLSFSAGNNIKFRVQDAVTGKISIKTLAVRDELRKTIISRMGSAISTANSIVTHQQGQDDRAIVKFNDDSERSIYQSVTPMDFTNRVNLFAADPQADPDVIAKVRKAGEWVNFGGNVSIAEQVDSAKADIIAGNVVNLEQIQQRYETGINQTDRLELAELLRSTRSENFFTKQEPFKVAEALLRSTLIPKVPPGFSVNIGPSPNDIATEQFNRARAQLMLDGWKAQKAGTLPADPNVPAVEGEFDFVIRAQELAAQFRDDGGQAAAALAAAQSELGAAREAHRAADTPAKKDAAKARIRAAERVLRSLEQ